MGCTLAPISKSGRKFAARLLNVAEPTDRDVEALAADVAIEFRSIPTKLAVMHYLLSQSWDMVHRLSLSGVKFAGTHRQATLIIAGTAYAAWRSSITSRARRHEDAHPVLVVGGLSNGIEFALWHKSGIPAMYADDYVTAVADSKDPIDEFTPIEALAKVWPRWYADGRLRFTAPRFVPVDESRNEWAAEFWAQRPNVLTASTIELRQARAAESARRVCRKTRRCAKAK